MSLAYDEYLAEHIGNVNKGLHWMLDNLPLTKTEQTAIEDAMLNAHDESKFDTAEYDPYDQYFYGGNQSYAVKVAFDYAWLHHIHHNPHHWQYWVLLEDDPETGVPFKALRIPLPYIFEMVADWWTFSWKNNNLFEIFNWYADHRHKQFIHPESRAILENVLKKIWNVLVMQETVAGHDVSEIEAQYMRVWTEQDVDLLDWDHPSARVIGKVVDMHETENGLEVTVEHSGIKGQKWGIRNGPPYPLGEQEKLDGVKKLNDLMNSGWDYGVLDKGQHLLDTDDYDWDKNYRTTPIDILDKEKIGTCWDFVNYQHDKLKNMGIKDDSYMITIKKSEKPDDIVTHTFTTFDLGDKTYWLESAAWPKRGVHEISGIEDVAKELNDMYHSPGYGLSIFKYDPEGMDKGLTSNEFFDKATQNLVYDRGPSQHTRQEVYTEAKRLEKELKELKANKDSDPELVELVQMELNDANEELEFLHGDLIEHSDISNDEDDKHRYGIPSLKKFPMPDKRHVKSAIRFFNYVDPKHEKELANAILSRIEEFGLVLGEDITVGDDNRFKKYLPEEKES